MKVIKFLSGHLMYQPGETAGFADDVALALIEAGVGVDAAAQAEADATAAKAEADAAAAQAEADAAAAQAEAAPTKAKRS